MVVGASVVVVVVGASVVVVVPDWTETFLVVVAESPSASVTVRVTTCAPSVVNVLVTLAPVCTEPSGKVHLYVAGALAVELEPSKRTVSGAGPDGLPGFVVIRGMMARWISGVVIPLIDARLAPDGDGSCIWSLMIWLMLTRPTGQPVAPGTENTPSTRRALPLDGL